MPDEDGLCRTDDAAFHYRLTTYVAIGSGVMLAGAILPRDDVTIWQWVGAGVVLIAVIVVICVVVQRLDARRAHRSLWKSPPFALLMYTLGYVACGCLAYGLSGSLGMYRLLLIGPLLISAAVGSRATVLASAAICLGVLLAVTYSSDEPLSTLPAFAVSYGAMIFTVAIVVRELAQRGNQAVTETALVDLSRVAAEADSVPVGLARMMPIIAGYLDAASVSAYEVQHRILADEPVEVWPRALTPTSEELSDLRIAAVDGRAVFGRGRCCFAVRDAQGVALVVLVLGVTTDPVANSRLERGIERVVNQLEVLLTRLSLHQQLEGMVRTDVLTGLPNRRALNERLSHDIAVSSRTGSAVSVAMLDVDHFKRYNDDYGHQAGDDLLVALAEMMRLRVRSSDFIARYGGEEFCAVLPATRGRDAIVLFDELRRRCQTLDGLRPVTFSAGIAEWDGTETIAQLIERADRALYRSKDAGRDCTTLDDRTRSSAADPDRSQARPEHTRPSGAAGRPSPR